MSHALYRALKSAGVDDALAQEAARSVVTVDGVETLATKTDLAELRAATKADFAELRAEFTELKTGTRADFTALKAEFVDLRASTRTDIAEVKVAIADLRSELLKWNIGAMAILTVIYSAIAAALRFVKP